MPNWCDNNLTVCGDADKIEKFNEEFVEEGYNCCLKIPEELKGTTSPTRIIPDEKYEDEASVRFELSLGTKGIAEKPISQTMSEELIEKYGADNWYSWQVQFWGVKWNVDNSELDPVIMDDGKEVSYSFNSPWGPPDKWIPVCAKHYQLEITLTYCEPGCDFCGILKADVEGNIIDDRCSGYRSDLGIELFGAEYYENDREYIIEHILDENDEDEIYEMLKELGFKKGDDAEKFMDELEIDDLLELELG